MSAGADVRPRFGAWTYRFGFSIVLCGYGLALGPNRQRGHDSAWQRDWVFATTFRAYGYRGFGRRSRSQGHRP